MKRALVVGAVALVSMLGAVAPAAAGGNTKSYVVLLKDGRDPAKVATADGVAPTQVWDEVGGFAADLTTQQVNRLRADAAVESVEVDGVFASIRDRSSAPLDQPAQAVKAAVRRVGGLESPTAKIDGIDERIDADIAILDGGIQPDHPDLNVVGGQNCVGNGKSWDDRDGHGTMVAGSPRRRTTASASSASRPVRGCGQYAWLDLTAPSTIRRCSAVSTGSSSTPTRSRSPT